MVFPRITTKINKKTTMKSKKVQIIKGKYAGQSGKILGEHTYENGDVKVTLEIEDDIHYKTTVSVKKSHLSK